MGKRGLNMRRVSPQARQTSQPSAGRPAIPPDKVKISPPPFYPPLGKSAPVLPCNFMESGKAGADISRQVSLPPVLPCNFMGQGKRGADLPHEITWPPF